MKMTKNWMVIFLMVFSTGLFAQSFEEYNKDGDDVISKEEFTEVFTQNYYEKWNTDNDQYVDQEDFYTYSYYILDTDDDDMLSEDEWSYGYDYLYGDYLDDDFDMFDVDGDGYLEYTDYYDSLYETDYYVSWDLDNDDNLNEQEIAEGVFKAYDQDDDGEWSESEFQEFQQVYSDY